MRFKAVVGSLLIIFGLVSSPLSHLTAQEIVSQQKRIAIRQLIEAFEMPRHSSSAFEEMTRLYQENWKVAVMADLRAKGFFNRYTPKQSLEVEKVINEFSNDLFGKVRQRMRAEVFTTESLEKMVEPIFDKYLTEDELNELVEFSRSSSGRKLIEAYYKVLTEATVLRMKKSGVFDVQTSPEAEEAKFDKLKKDSESDPLTSIQEIFSTAGRLAREQYTQSETQELSIFARKSLWMKLARVSPNMAVEVQANSARLFGPQVEKLTQEVMSEQLEILGRRINNALRPLSTRH